MAPTLRIVTAALVAAELAAGFATADWNTGRELYNQGHFAEAAVHFQEMVESNPNWPSGYLMLGRCQLAREEYEAALENLQTAFDLNPDDPTNTVTLARALMTVDRHGEARELLDGLETEDLTPVWRAEVARMQAACLIEEDRAADAVALLEKGLADDPDSPALHRALAAAHKASGDRAAALDDLDRTFSLDPTDHTSGRAAIITALSLAASAGDDELADAYSRRALEIADALATAAPGYEHTLLAGEAALGAGQLGAAAGWFAAAVKIRPHEPQARFDLGRTLATLERNDEAITHLRAALGAAPEDELAMRIHSQLGRLLACDLELPEAARHYRAAGENERANQIGEVAEGFRDAMDRLASLRNSAAQFALMEAELEELGDAQGVTALADRRKDMRQKIVAIEENLSQVRAALCE